MKSTKYTLVFKAFGIFISICLVHLVLNKFIFELSNIKFFTAYYSHLFFTSLAILSVLIFSEYKTVLVYLGLTLVKILAVFGYTYPLLIDLEINYIYHVLVLFTIFQFIEIALLSKTLKIS